MSPTPALTIRPIGNLDEIKQVEALQKEAWGFGDLDVVPLPLLVPASEFGGILLGAFDGAKLAGFVFGFLAKEGGHLLIHSQMLAVGHAYRKLGLGYQLKLAQRTRVLASGIGRIAWTFDPLQTVNAHLNFGKLGVLCNSYRVNFYGESTSSYLHSNGTDRMLVTWLLDSPRVTNRIGQGFPEASLLEKTANAPVLLRVGAGAKPHTGTAEKGAPLLRIEVPAAAGQLGPEAALEWRQATREAFARALGDGYLVTDFCRAENGVYLLTRAESLEDCL